MEDKTTVYIDNVPLPKTALKYTISKEDYSSDSGRNHMGYLYLKVIRWGLTKLELTYSSLNDSEWRAVNNIIRSSNYTDKQSVSVNFYDYTKGYRTTLNMYVGQSYEFSSDYYNIKTGETWATESRWALIEY